jgi:CxxC-x17-CxxC domain-containing protein
MYVKLMIDGITSEPFSATNLPPIKNFEHNSEKIINLCRERYCVPRKEIEEKIRRWASKDDTTGQATVAPKEARYKTKCSKCQREVFVPFLPDGVRPVYCKECLKAIKGQTK